MGKTLSMLFCASGPVRNTAPVTRVAASGSRLSRLSASAGLAAEGDVDAHITVVSDQQICLALVADGSGRSVPVEGVTIRVKDILNADAKEAAYTTDEDGSVILPTHRFITDKYDIIHVQLAVDGEARGYRNIAIDGLAVIADAHTSTDPDEKDLPDRLEPYNYIKGNKPSQSLVVLALEPDADGRLCAELPNTTVNSYRRYVITTDPWEEANWKYAYDSFTDPHIDDIEAIWSNRDKRELSGFRFRGSMPRIRYPEDADAPGVTFFCYNGLDGSYSIGITKLLTEKGEGFGAYEGYDRAEIIASLRDRQGVGLWDVSVGRCPDFIALNRPGEENAGEAFIEMFDRKMNDARDPAGRRGVKLVEGDIRHIAMLPTSARGETTLFYAQAEKNNDGVEINRLNGLVIQPTEVDGDRLEINATRCAFDVTLPSDRFCVGYIGAVPYVYWVSASPEGDDVDRTVWRIWGAAYDPGSGTMSDAGVLAQFELSRTKVRDRDVEVVPTDVLLTASNTGYLIGKAVEKASDDAMPPVSLYSFP